METTVHVANTVGAFNHLPRLATSVIPVASAPQARHANSQDRRQSGSMRLRAANSRESQNQPTHAKSSGNVRR